MRLISIAESLEGYNRRVFASDAAAALVVTFLLVPQSLAYAMVAGLPPEMGLYSSMFPLIFYAVLGTSRTLSVGPVAVVSLMTATSVGRIAEQGSIGYVGAAVALAALSGCILIGMGLARLGPLASLLSRPVMSGFISASAVLIAISQLQHLLGVSAAGSNLPAIILDLIRHWNEMLLPTLAFGLASMGFLLSTKLWGCSALQLLGFSRTSALNLVKLAPAVLVLAVLLLGFLISYHRIGLPVVGAFTADLPTLVIPRLSAELWAELTTSALLIALVGYIESVTVAKTLAAKREQTVDPDRELVALGAANVASSVSGGFPVSGGFSRSVVNFDAGAQTQVASILAAIAMALVILFAAPLLYQLPKTVLAAAIIVAVLSLVDFQMIFAAWRYSHSDFAAVSVTILFTLMLGVELGVLVGILLSISLHFHRTTKPHVAVIGEVPGTGHFRNVRRHSVITDPGVLSLRIDESLHFANADYLRKVVSDLLREQNWQVEHLVLQCSAVNAIDLSAVLMMQELCESLSQRGIALHLSEVKGPVMDSLKRSDMLARLSGRVFLCQQQAMEALTGDTTFSIQQNTGVGSPSR
ncbi:MAG: sulfate permease [Pseudomonadota bacterium]